MATDREQRAAIHLRAGRDALARGAWKEAVAEFEEALVQEETPEALEELAMAASRIDDRSTAMEVRQIAYWHYHRLGNWAGAARMATWLAIGHAAVSPDQSNAQTWLTRAHEALGGRATVAESGWLDLSEGKIALVRGDVPTARRLGAEAARIGRQLGLIELERDGLSLAKGPSDGELERAIRRRALPSRVVMVAVVLLIVLALGAAVVIGVFGRGVPSAGY